MVRTGVTLADAAAEWLRFIEEDRERKPSTLNDYRSALKAHLLPAFGEQPLESITPEQIDVWRRGLTGLSNRSKNKLLIQLHGIFRRAQMVWGLQANPLARVEKHPMRRWTHDSSECHPHRRTPTARGSQGWSCPAGRLKAIPVGSDQHSMTNPHLPVTAGPVSDKLTIWPVDDGRYGLDATFQGAPGYERAEHHQQEGQRRGVPHSFRQELGGGSTLRFGPFGAIDMAAALSAFVY